MSRSRRVWAGGLPRVDRVGRVPTWIPFGIFLVGVIWFFDGLSQGVAAAGFERIDPRSSKLDVRGGFVDPRWNDILREEMARLPEASTHDREAVARIAASVSRLPFVAEIGEPRVLWPDGVDVPLRLRRAGACVQQRGEFLIVAEDGTILPGRWPTPPWIATEPGKLGFLPVIGPNDGAFDDARPGDRLHETRHLDALAVAVSMRANLTQDDFERLGPPLIDATQARVASVEIPGVLIRLEAGRVVYFGRSPLATSIGERPIEDKWADLRKATALLASIDGTAPPGGAKDWVFLDVRWEHGDIAWRESSEPETDSTKKNGASSRATKGSTSGNGSKTSPPKGSAGGPRPPR